MQLLLPVVVLDGLALGIAIIAGAAERVRHLDGAQLVLLKHSHAGLKVAGNAGGAPWRVVLRTEVVSAETAPLLVIIYQKRITVGNLLSGGVVILPILLPVSAVLVLVQVELRAVPVGAHLDAVLGAQIGTDPL